MTSFYFKLKVMGIPIIKFGGFTCQVMIGMYPNEQSLIRLLDCEDSLPVAVASVCIPNVELGDDEVLIKSWSENKGMEAILIAQGIIGPSLGEVPTGHTIATRHKLLKN